MGGSGWTHTTKGERERQTYAQLQSTGTGLGMDVAKAAVARGLVDGDEFPVEYGPDVVVYKVTGDEIVGYQDGAEVGRMKIAEMTLIQYVGMLAALEASRHQR